MLLTRRVKGSTVATLVLGSASPRRRELLSHLGLAFGLCEPVVDESRNAGESPGDYLERIVLAKLGSVRGQLSDRATAEHSWVLVADTIVVSPAGIVMGKPATMLDASEMLSALSGTTHEVATRFILGAARPSAATERAETVVTRVTFRRLTEGERTHYVASREGFDKAGGYAIQGAAAAFVERIEGSYTNVVGLPLSELVVAMRDLGIR
jgi:septum formation protein